MVDDDTIDVRGSAQPLTLACGNGATYQQAFLQNGYGGYQNAGRCYTTACVNAITCPAPNATQCSSARSTAEANAMSACNSAVASFSSSTNCAGCPAGQTGCQRGESGGCTSGGSSVCSPSKATVQVYPTQTWPVDVKCGAVSTGAANADKSVWCEVCEECQMAGSGSGSGGNAC